MLTAHRFRPVHTALAGMMLIGTACADTPCVEFAWDIRAEHLLYAMQAAPLVGGVDRATTPRLSVDRLYQLHLQPQSTVQFPTPPGGRPPSPEGFAGLASLQVAVAGVYRISADQPLWIDVAFNGALLKPQDFQARKGCSAPHKIVTFALPMGVPLTLQFSNAQNPEARITITPEPGPAH